MPEPRRFDFANVGGGQYSGLPAHRLSDNQFESLVNFRSFGTKIIRRRGIQRLTNTAFGEQITSLFAFKNNDTDDYVLFVGGLTGIGKQDGSAYVTLPYSLGGALASESFPWIWTQYKNVAYAVRRNTGRMKRIATDFYTDAGISPPGTAPTLADSGVGGNPPAGTYYGVVTFYNNETGAESDPSDPSAGVTTAGANQISWSAIPTAVPQGQVTSRRLWRTLPNQTGVYYLVAEIADNITTTYTDNVSTAGLGSAASYKNGLPPTNQKYMTGWKERCWLSNGVDVYFSEIGLFEGFGPSSIIQVNPDDGGQIRVLFPWQDRLVIGKTNGIFYLVGTDESDFALNTLSEKHGCWSHHSMKEIEGNLVWFGGDNFYRSGGENPQAISTYQVRTELDDIPEDERELVYAAVLPEKQWYLASIPQSTGRKILCYNYRSSAWSVWNTPDAFAFFGDVFNSDQAPRIYGCMDAKAASEDDEHAYEFDSGTDDYGTAITASFLTKAHHFDKEGQRKALRGVSLLCPQYAEELELHGYYDLAAIPTKSRSVSLNHARQWKRFSLSDLQNLWNHLQVGLEYSGSSEIEIEGYAVETVLHERFGGRRL